jgi:hypothetical protein
VIPIALFMVLLRYKLWDVDRVINRALVYTVVTGFLGAIYLAGIVVVGNLLRTIATDRASELATIITTLAVAALFQPARSRVQRFVDRRFYRRKYDAGRTVEAFSQNIRHETDLDSLAQDLIDVVHVTMQPTHVSLWLPDQDGDRSRAPSDSSQR